MSEEDVAAKGSTASGKRQVPLEAAAKHWSTPTTSLATDGNASRGGARSAELLLTGQARNWPTPVVQDGKDAARGTTTTGVMHPGVTLTDAIRQWPTPTARDGDNRGATSSKSAAWKSKVERGAVNAAGMLSDDLKSSVTNWPTPTAMDGMGGPGHGAMEGSPSLRTTASHWPTPAARDHKGANSPEHEGHGDQLPNFVANMAARGLLHSLPDQTTLKAGEPSSQPTRVLNPRFVEMLMGWPPGWTDCGFAATASSTSSLSSPSAPSGIASRRRRKKADAK